MKKPNGSWRTSAVGILGGVVIIANQLIALLDQDPNTVLTIEGIAAGLAAFGIGMAARDKKDTDA